MRRRQSGESVILQLTPRRWIESLVAADLPGTTASSKIDPKTEFHAEARRNTNSRSKGVSVFTLRLTASFPLNFGVQDKANANKRMFPYLYFISDVSILAA